MLVGTCAFLALPPAPLAAPGSQAPPGTDHRAAEGEQQRRADRSTPAAAEQRRRSRSAYRGLGRDDALSLGRRTDPSVYSDPVWRTPELGRGEVVDRFLNDRAVRIKRGDQFAYMESSLPMRVADEHGEKSPVDLTLRRRDGELAPVNPLVDVRFPLELAQGLHLRDAGVTVRPVAPRGAGAPEIVGERAFWNEIAPDTDLLAMVTPTGFETFHQLRSPASPEQVRFELDLPAGAYVRAQRAGDALSGDTTGGFEIVRDGTLLATVSAPRAWDAQGEPVRVVASLQGGDLVLGVEHRTLDLAYPIQVDPAFDGFHWRDGGRGGTSPGVYDNWRYGSNSSADWWPGYTPTSNPGGYGNGAYGWGAGLGLFTWAADSTFYNPGQYAEWQYWAYGDAHIYRAEFGYTHHKAAATTLMRGIWAYRNGRWDSGQCIDGRGYWCTNTDGSNVGGTPTSRWDSFANHWEVHYAVNNSSWDGSPGNIAIFKLQKHSRPAAPPDGAGQFGISYIFQWDKVAPFFASPNWWGGPAVDHYGPLVTAGTQPPTKWAADGVAMTARPWVRDDGLGVNHISVIHPRRAEQGGGEKEIKWSKWDCGGDQNRRTRPCPDRVETSIGYSTSDLPEGINSVRARGYDYSNNYVDGNAGNGAQWKVKVDRSGPTIGTFSGSLWDRRNRGVRTVDSALRVIATDGSDVSDAAARSGVRRVELLVDGSSVDSFMPGLQAYEQACDRAPRDSCNMDRTFGFDPSVLGEGRHTISVRAWDQLNNFTTSSGFDVFVDRTKPSVTIAGDLAEAADYRPVSQEQDADLLVQGSDATAGVESIQILVDNNPAGPGDSKTVACSGGHCPLGLDFLWDPNRVAPGDHLVSVLVTDGSNNTERLDWHIDVEGPQGAPPPDEDPDAPTSGAVRSDKGSPSFRACEDAGQAVPFETFSLGIAFEGLLATYALRRCDVPYPGEANRANFVSYIYGDCSLESPDADDERCVPPLEVQSWPACERSRADYLLPPRNVPLPRTDTSAQGVPASMYEDGYRLEMYTGATTVVVFGSDAAQVTRAAQAIRAETSDPPLLPVAVLPLTPPQPVAGAMNGTLSCLS